MNDTEKIILALEFIKANDWEAAHNIAQSKEGHSDYDRIHALLHRIEGDEWNAKYWYSRCKIPFPRISVEEEVEELTVYYKKEGKA
jgi:hypothetical protein